MKIHMLYFAAAREQLGRTEEILQVREGSTAGELLTLVESRLGATLRSRIRVAVNEQFVSNDQALREGDLVALIPPIAGGGVSALRDVPLSIDEAVTAVQGPDAGATCLFLGTVRDHNASHRVKELHYEAYREMCERTFEQIRMEARERFGARLSILHRVGRLEVGEIAVIVTAAAAHRAEAFAACRYGIDTLKERAPIWKKEIGADGEAWVGCGA